MNWFRCLRSFTFSLIAPATFTSYSFAIGAAFTRSIGSTGNALTLVHFMYDAGYTTGYIATGCVNTDAGSR